MKKWHFILSVLVLGLTSCQGFFGEKTDLSFIDKPNYQDREVAYVPIQPVLDNFVKPSQVMAGFDQLIYVVDEGTQEIISFDLSGRELARIKVPGVRAISQDRKFDILATGVLDTVITRDTISQSFSLACVYRIQQKSNGLLGLQYGEIKPVVIHPFYTGTKDVYAEDELVRFTSIATLANNDYYVARSGDGRDAILTVLPDIDGTPDKRVSRVLVQTSTGLELNYFLQPSAITTLSKPPQVPGITQSRDFIYCSSDPDLALKVQYIKYEETQDGGVYSLKEMARGDTSKADGFLYEPNKFSQPVGATFAGDRTNYIFVVDAGKDSLYQFTNEGYEGVNPPPFSTDRKQVLASFGGTGISLTQFNNPTSVAYFQNIVYVADAGNGRVLRFKLTTDFR